MAWSYGLAPGTDTTDAVRLLTGDTDTNRQLLQDEEVDYFVDTEHNVWMAAAIAADAIVAKNGKIGSKKVGSLSLSSIQIQALVAQAAYLRRRGLSHQGLSVGGTSLADKRVLELNTDWPDRDFIRKMMDHPGKLSVIEQERVLS